MSRRLFAVPLLITAILSAALVLSLLVSPAEAAMPTKKRWISETYRALSGSGAHVGDRVAKGGHKLAINFDIDNTALATYYDSGKPVAVSLRLARYADSKGVSILFNTGRLQGRLTPIVGALRRAGYPVDGICSRKKGERLVKSKQRCRRQYTARGFTLIANVGNRSTDFVGGNYERAYKLPNYGNRLG